MYGLAYVLVPSRFESLQSELDRALAAFKRGGKGDFPCDKLIFDDSTEWLLRLHQSSFRYNPDRGLTGLAANASYDLSLTKLTEHLTACRLDGFEGTFAELEPDFDAFVRGFTRYEARDTETGRYGRWLNPLGFWDWWELGGRFNGVITGEPRPAGLEQTISSGPSVGRAIMGNLGATLGACGSSEGAEIEANVELVETLRLAGDGRRISPTALVLPLGCCTDEHRWFDHVEWHEIKPGTRAFLGVSANADFKTMIRAAYVRFSDHAVAGIAYHF